MENTDDSSEQIVDQAIQTLHQLMNVLQSLDDNLKLLTKEVLDVNSGYEEDRPTIRKSQPSHYVDGENDGTAKASGQAVEGNNSTSTRHSVRKSIRASQYVSENNVAPNENVDISGSKMFVNESEHRQTKSLSEPPSDANRKTLQGNDRKSIRHSIRKSARSSHVGENSSVLDTNTDINAPNVRASAHERTKSLSGEPTVGKENDGRAGVRKSIRQSQMSRGTLRESHLSEDPTLNAGSSAKQSVSGSKFQKRQSHVGKRGQSVMVGDASVARPSKADIAGRLTIFLNQFDTYVTDISGKIEALNERVVALGENEGEENKQSE